MNLIKTFHMNVIGVSIFHPHLANFSVSGKFYGNLEADTYLTVEENCIDGCHSVCLKEETNADNQVWKLVFNNK
jgi:hypothetical protein